MEARMKTSLTLCRGFLCLLVSRKLKNRLGKGVLHGYLGNSKRNLKPWPKGNLVFSQLKLDQKMAYFIPFGSNDKEAYDKGVSVAELFPVNVTGIVSGNDGYPLLLPKLN